MAVKSKIKVLFHDLSGPVGDSINRSMARKKAEFAARGTLASDFACRIVLENGLAAIEQHLLEVLQIFSRSLPSEKEWNQVEAFAMEFIDTWAEKIWTDAQRAWDQHGIGVDRFRPDFDTQIASIRAKVETFIRAQRQVLSSASSAKRWDLLKIVLAALLSAFLAALFTRFLGTS